MTNSKACLRAIVALLTVGACSQTRVRISPLIDGYNGSECITPHGQRQGYTGTRRWERMVPISDRAAANILAWHGPEEQLNVFWGPASPSSASTQVYVHVIDMRVDDSAGWLYVRARASAGPNVRDTFIYGFDLRRPHHSERVLVDDAVLLGECPAP